MGKEISIVDIEGLFKEFIISKKKTKVLDISRKYFCNNELSIIKALFSKVLFDHTKNAKLKDYKNYFNKAFTYENDIVEFMNMIESKEYRDYLYELSDLFLLLNNDEFLLKLNKFDLLFLKDRSYTMYR
jgi:hypothetical protein